MRKYVIIETIGKEHGTTLASRNNRGVSLSPFFSRPAKGGRLDAQQGKERLVRAKSSADFLVFCFHLRLVLFASSQR